MIKANIAIVVAEGVKETFVHGRDIISKVGKWQKKYQTNRFLFPHNTMLLEFKCLTPLCNFLPWLGLDVSLISRGPPPSRSKPWSTCPWTKQANGTRHWQNLTPIFF